MIVNGTGKKHDEGKYRYELVPARALESVARVLTLGAIKYGVNDWRNGIEYGRLFGAAMRHMWSWWSGEDNDTETSLHHLAHAITSLMFIIEFGYVDAELDDRITE